MVIEVLNQKYKCDCGRGMNKLEKPNLLRNLNLIMEWDLCKFPLKLPDDYVEKKDADGNVVKPEESDYIMDTKFLGEEPELKPGDCFLLDGGQVIAVNSPTELVLVVSETGAWALERIWNERIEPEFNLIFGGGGDVDVDVVWEDSVDDPNLNIYDGEIRLPSFMYEVWRSRFLYGRESEIKNVNGKINLVCEVISDIIPYPVHIILQNYSAIYRTDELFEKDIAEDVIKAVLIWFCNSFERKVNPLDIETEKHEGMKKLNITKLNG